jgi:predicted permease
LSLRGSIILIFARLRSWLRAVAGRARLEHEMDAELGDHLSRLTADLVRAGHSPADAARRARIALGPALAHKEEMRGSLGLRWWDALGADLRYAARMLKKSPGFTLVAAISLALAIGANTTIFSVAKQLLYERLAARDSAELRLLAWTGKEDHVAVHHDWGNWDPLPGGLITGSSFPYPAYTELRAHTRALGDLFAFKETGANATVRGEAMRVRIEMVSGNYYAELGVGPQLGRGIGPADDAAPGQGPVAVISDGLWARSFGRSPAVIGQIIKVNDTPFTIVGVNPRGFTGARSVQVSPEVFIPLNMQPLASPMRGGSLLTDPAMWWVNIMGRVQRDVKETAARVALDGQLSAFVRGASPLRKGDELPQLVLLDGSRGLFEQQQQFAKPMTVLMTLVGFVLLLACANIANLMLARGSQRQREMSVRLALGAGRLRILRQMLVESLMLAALGGTGGLVAGYLGRNIIPKMTENAWERTDFQVHFDWKVFAFTAAVTILTGLLFGLAPALSAARHDVNYGLKEAAKTTTRRRKGVGGKALVGFQIALSTLLVIGAGLFLRTLAGLSAVDVGFRTDNLLLAEINLPQNRYPAGKDIALHQRVERAFAEVPGVDSVSVAMEAYVADDLSRTDFLPEGERYEDGKRQGEDYNVVGNRFFETLGIPIVAGRGFGEQDTASSMKVGIINQSLAKRRFPNQNPVGKRFSTGGHNVDGHEGKLATNWIQIVGVCGDTRYTNMREEPPPQFFLPYVQQTQVGGMVYELHTRMSPAAILPDLRRVVRSADPDLPLVDVRTQKEQIEADLEQERVFVTLTSGFGLLALALASVGIYGIMAYSVANRTSEIGIRLALGAPRAQVRGMILRESAGLAVVGIAVGLGGALLMTNAVKSMLYGIAPYDPLTLAGGTTLLFAVALAASWIPARRAAGVQPVVALRHE